MPLSLAIFNPLTMFFELPLVVIPIAISPFTPNASICRANIASYPISFETAVITDLSTVIAIAGNDRFWSSLSISKFGNFTI